MKVDKKVPGARKKAPKDATTPAKSKKYNSKSLDNLRQFQETDEILIPEILPTTDLDGRGEAEEITRGKKLSPELVMRLIPSKGVFNTVEMKRFVGIVTQYLADFKEEEPTASDVDDIFEIAKSDVLEMRILSATRNDPAALLTASQFLEKNNKRKQVAKENLSARRSDRKDPKAVQGITIVDLVVAYDGEKKRSDQERVDSLMAQEIETVQALLAEIEKDG